MSEEEILVQDDGELLGATGDIHAEGESLSGTFQVVEGEGESFLDKVKDAEAELGDAKKMADWKREFASNQAEMTKERRQMENHAGAVNQEMNRQKEQDAKQVLNKERMTNEATHKARMERAVDANIRFLDNQRENNIEMRYRAWLQSVNNYIFAKQKAWDQEEEDMAEKGEISRREKLGRLQKQAAARSSVAMEYEQLEEMRGATIAKRYDRWVQKEANDMREEVIQRKAKPISLNEIREIQKEECQEMVPMRFALAKPLSGHKTFQEIVSAFYEAKEEYRLIEELDFSQAQGTNKFNAVCVADKMCQESWLPIPDCKFELFETKLENYNNY